MRKTGDCDTCLQTMPSSPLLAGTNTTERVVESTHVKSLPANVTAPSVTTHHRHSATADTPIVKTAKDTPKPSGSGVGKQTVDDAAPDKPAASLFTDDNDAADDDLFAPSAASKVLAPYFICHLL